MNKNTISRDRVATRSQGSIPDEEKPRKTIEEDENLPQIEFRGRTYLQINFEECARMCDQIIQRIEKLKEEIVPIGFDLEWPVLFPNVVKKHKNLTNKTALAQLCISPRTCHLFHIYNLPKLPAAFVHLLSHPKVKLVGVNVRQDVRKLGRDFPGFPHQQIVDNNCLECGLLANQHLKTTERWSLAKLTAFLLKKRLDKRSSVRKSGWHKLPLSEEKKTYAATDAYASLLTYLSIIEKASSADETLEDVGICR